jgi:hypothetical protein
MAKRYLVTLSDDERAHLRALTKRGKIAARKLTRAHILLQADAGVVDAPLRRRSTSGRPRSSGFASALSKRGWRRH